VSSFAAQASLIVAAFDLFAVTAVTGAIRAADLESGDVLTPAGIVEKPEPAPAPDADTYESKQNDQPQLVLVKQPAYAAPVKSQNAPRPTPPLPREVIIPVCDLAPEPASAPTNPIEPPWKVLPWMDRPHQRVVFVREIKRVVSASDMSLRGKMLDLVV
jgi:hypothetical protein